MFLNIKKKIGVYACVEHEFSIAGKRNAGANPIDLLEFPDHITHLRKQCDYVVVLYHGGKEYYRYPSPNLQKISKKFVEKGADLVICQHSHCVGSYERYKDSVIVYGQGNFLFDDGEMECLQTGMLIKIDDDFSISFIPICKDGYGVCLADSQSSKMILRDLETRSEEIKNSDIVEMKYKNFAEENYHFYLKALNGKKIKKYHLKFLIKYLVVGGKIFILKKIMVRRNF